ncbi:MULTISPECIES: GTP-binding protein [unclassified Nocardiopsis]|uniref:GTP-binding protein n=1 Tax=Nocardiopsis TaxID=2013 RepID=UPI00387B87E5
MTTGRPTRTLVVSGIHENARRSVVRALREAVPGIPVLRFDPARPLPTGSGRPRIVEVPGGIDPAVAVETITAPAASPHTAVTAVVAAVDGRRCVGDLLSDETARARGLRGEADDPRTVAEVLLRQIDYADHLALVETGRSGHRDRLCGPLLNHLNPAARILTDPAPADLAPLLSGRFDGVGAALRLTPAFPPVPPHTGEPAVTVVWRRFRPLHPERFYEALDEMTEAGVRSRGRLWLASMPDTMLAWEAVGPSVSFERSGPWLAALPASVRPLAASLRGPSGTFDWHPRTGDRCQHIAFTGLGADSAHLLALLDSCLLTEEEVLAWEKDGPLCDDPFGPLLEGGGDERR